jgi:hypothetical protein
MASFWWRTRKAELRETNYANDASMRCKSVAIVPHTLIFTMPIINIPLSSFQKMKAVRIETSTSFYKYTVISVISTQNMSAGFEGIVIHI